jgi:hypothetical protein
MKKIIQICAVAMTIFIFWSCEPSGVFVGARLETPYYERPIRPGPDYIWLEGDWFWQNGGYVYHHGHWARPRPHHEWVPGSWEQRNGGWHWKKGKWRGRGRH